MTVAEAQEAVMAALKAHANAIARVGRAHEAVKESHAQVDKARKDWDEAIKAQR